MKLAGGSIGAALGGGVSGLQWVVDAYSLTFAALILAAGALGDRRGAKRVLLGGFALFTLASVACGLAPTIGMLIAARAVQGIGAAALAACSLALLNYTFPEAGERARAVGICAAVGAAALAAGPLVGGVLITTVGDLLHQRAAWRGRLVVRCGSQTLGTDHRHVTRAETVRPAREKFTLFLDRREMSARYAVVDR